MFYIEIETTSVILTNNCFLNFSFSILICGGSINKILYQTKGIILSTLKDGEISLFVTQLFLKVKIIFKPYFSFSRRRMDSYAATLNHLQIF